MHNFERLQKYLYLSQGTLFAGLLICTAIMPSVAARNGGVSNYGNYLVTAPFYVLAFALNSLFLYLAARDVGRLDRRLRYVARALAGLSIFTLVILLSTFPRHFSHIYSDLHDGLGVVLYGYYLLISVWIVRKIRTILALSLLTIEVVGSLIGFLSLLKVVQLLLIGQLIGALGFGLLLCVALPTVIKEWLQSMEDYSGQEA